MVAHGVNKWFLGVIKSMTRSKELYIGKHKVVFGFLGDCILCFTVEIDGRIVNKSYLEYLYGMKDGVNYLSCQQLVSGLYFLKHDKCAAFACYCFKEYGLSKSEFWKLYHAIGEYFESLRDFTCSGCLNRFMTMKSCIHNPEVLNETVKFGDNDFVRVISMDLATEKAFGVHLTENGEFLSVANYSVTDLNMRGHKAYLLSDIAGRCPLSVQRLLVLDNKPLNLLFIGELVDGGIDDDDSCGEHEVGCYNIQFIRDISPKTLKMLTEEWGYTLNDIDLLCASLDIALSGGSCSDCN